jgi:hypothetical protein
MVWFGTAEVMLVYLRSGGQLPQVAEIAPVLLIWFSFLMTRLAVPASEAFGIGNATLPVVSMHMDSMPNLSECADV